MSKNKRFKLFVENYETQADIGLLEFEKGVKQRLIISIEAVIEIDTSSLWGNENKIYIEQSQNYVEYIQMIEAILEECGHIDMVEEFSERLAQRICTQTPTLTVKIKTTKPDILSGSVTVGCEIERTKADYHTVSLNDDIDIKAVA